MAKGDFDYIIVGAGSAGCALAYRLSKDPSIRVLVLEAGGWDRNPWIHIPLGWPRLLTKRMDDWMYFSEPQQETGGTPMEFARGKVVGGSSSINAMAYVRGNAADYDRWASYGLKGWSYKDVLPYFRRQESWEGGENEYRGGDGPLTTRFSTFEDPLADAFTEAGLAAGHPFTEDYNGAQQHGFGKWQFTIRNGRRCSAAVAYLRPALKRPNVTLELNALASRIELVNGSAVGVSYIQNNELNTVFAEREVLLSGGVVNSPQLLNISGIGDPDDLKKAGVETQIALPGIGKNLQDHISAAIQYERKDTGTLYKTMRLDRVLVDLANTYFFGKGVSRNLPSGTMAFLKSSPDQPVPDLQFKPVLASMTAQPHLSPFYKGYQDGFALRAIVVRPKSRGRITLKSDDPKQAPTIEQNFLTERADRNLLHKGLRMARDIGRQQPMQEFVASEIAPAGFSDQELDAHIAATGITVHHPAGTCKMGTDDDPASVVDEQLRVRGIKGLRVVDASVMPDLVGGNINAAVTMIAEKASDLILER